MILRILLIVGTISLFAACERAENRFELKPGDILFQDLDCGPFCESIETVTPGINGAELSHCGIVIMENKQLKVIEAGGKGVVITDMDSFLTRARDGKFKPKVLVGRVKDWSENDLQQAIAISKTYLGKPYDHLFDLENDSLYCSELVYYSYLENDKPIFETQPMTFKDPKTNELFSLWVDYYKEMNQPIPEGKLGLNPGGITLSDKIEIVHVYGYPENYMPE